MSDLTDRQRELLAAAQRNADRHEASSGDTNSVHHEEVRRYREGWGLDDTPQAVEEIKGIEEITSGTFNS